MKALRIGFILCIMASCLTTKSTAQEFQFRSNILDDFVGTWEYRHNGELFRLVLKKGTFELGSDGLIDCIVGGYAYRKSAGAPLVDYTAGIPTSSSDKTLKILGFSVAKNGPVKRTTHLAITFKDEEKEGKSSGMNSSLTLLSPTTARWVLDEDERIVLSDGRGNYYKGFEPKPQGFSVPTDVVLTKVAVDPPIPDNPLLPDPNDPRQPVDPNDPGTLIRP